MNVTNDKSKGGRKQRFNADYFGVPAKPTDEQKALMLKFKNEGLTFYFSIFQKLCGEDYFLWHFEKMYKLLVFADEFQFSVERFKEILDYAVNDVELFDKELYECGYIFSLPFVKNFDNAGLFAERKCNMEVIQKHIETVKKQKRERKQSEPKANEIIPEQIKGDKTTADQSERKEIKDKGKKTTAEESIVKESKGNSVEPPLTGVKSPLTPDNPEAISQPRLIEPEEFDDCPF